MPVVLPPSMSRIYVHNVEYKGENFITKENADEIVQLILHIKNTVLKDLQFQNIKIINIHNLNSTSVEIHINNVIYYLQRVLTLDLIDKLQQTLRTELNKNIDFSFEQINIINDEYVDNHTVGYYDGD